MCSFSLHQFHVEKWDFQAILTSNLRDVTKMQFVSGLTQWNINSTWKMYEQYYALCFFFLSQQPRSSIFSIWTTMFCFTHWLCLVAMRRKFYNIIPCKDILDPPFHYNNECTFKWFLEHNNELVCVQTLMPIFCSKIFPKTWYNA